MYLKSCNEDEMPRMPRFTTKQMDEILFEFAESEYKRVEIMEWDKHYKHKNSCQTTLQAAINRRKLYNIYAFSIKDRMFLAKKTIK